MKLRQVWLCAVVCMAAAMAGNAYGQGKEAEGKDTKLKGRLPPHFVPVVTEEQRQKIYALQAKYAPQIDAAEEQLDTLRTERDKAIDAVLTADQMTEVNKKRADARGKLQQAAKDRAKAREAGKEKSSNKAAAADDFFETPKSTAEAAPAPTVKPAVVAPAPRPVTAPK